MVAIGAALFTLLALQMASVTASAGYDATGDIGRILQGLVSGIGILGAGVFLHRGGTVRLATTGASVWLAGAVGIATGLGLYILAVAATALAILVWEYRTTISRAAPIMGPAGGRYVIGIVSLRYQRGPRK